MVGRGRFPDGWCQPWTFVFQPNGCIGIPIYCNPTAAQSCDSQFAVTARHAGLDGSVSHDIMFSCEDFSYVYGIGNFNGNEDARAKGETRCSRFVAPEVGEALADPSCAVPPVEQLVRWTVARTR